jgi:hypothetical protein
MVLQLGIGLTPRIRGNWLLNAVRRRGKNGSSGSVRIEADSILNRPQRCEFQPLVHTVEKNTEELHAPPNDALWNSGDSADEVGL